MIVGYTVQAADPDELTAAAATLRTFVARSTDLGPSPLLIRAGAPTSSIGKRAKDAAAIVILDMDALCENLLTEFPMAMKLTEKQSVSVAKQDIVVPPASLVDAINKAFVLAGRVHETRRRYRLAESCYTTSVDMSDVMQAFVYSQQLRGAWNINNAGCWLHAVGMKGDKKVAILRSNCTADRNLILSHPRQMTGSQPIFTLEAEGVSDTLSSKLDINGVPDESIENWANLITSANQVNAVDVLVEDELKKMSSANGKQSSQLTGLLSLQEALQKRSVSKKR